ncbi:MAG TPA: NAD-binding protein [Candidatus Deferrimicrobium sp.]|nr:NAD-binding protein [Candidatus Deferrimicrobium sp.]
MRKKLIKLKIILKQNLIGITILFLWFLIHFFAFFIISNGDPIQALQYTFYFKQEPMYGNFYSLISQVIIFGWIFMLVTVEIYRKYHPEQTCLALSRSMKDHTVIIGYSHLGQRIREYLSLYNKKFVVADSDRTLLKDLIENEEPVVPLDYIDTNFVKNTNVQDAKLVLITKNDLETLVIATNLIRDVNKKCRIICRCFDDSLAKVLEKKFACETISTSKYAADYILKEIQKLHLTDVLIIGCNNTARRLMQKFRNNNINYKLITKKRETCEDLLDEEPIIIADPTDKDLLIKAGIKTMHSVIILIDDAEQTLLIADTVRELNNDCRLISRFFYEEIAEILEKPPFNALIISTSKNTLEKLIEKGVFSDNTYIYQE